VKELILVRHASAGERSEWDGDDWLRPLDERGRSQAEALTTSLSRYEIDRILTSPFIRCVQTVEPLGAYLGVSVEGRIELAEGASGDEIMAVIAELEGAGAVICTHGDVVEELLGEEMKKGEARLLERPVGPPG
jgi:8-oxo-(d)GTP phosphatase